MKSYSQFEQDLWVLSIFPDVTDGFFVDVGCCDGERISNTYLLEQLGWRGIAADPFPSNFENRPNTILEKVAIFSIETELPFCMSGDIGGFSEFIDKWKNDKRILDGTIQMQKAITLENLLAKYNAPTFIHYLSLDTEGTEYEILRVFPFDKYIFGCLTIEHNSEEPKRTKIIELLQSNKYKLVKSDNVEDYFVHEDYLK